MVIPHADSSSNNCVTAGDISLSPGTTTAGQWTAHDEMIVAMHQNAHHK